MSRIRVDELINAGNTGPTSALEGLEIPVNKNLSIRGSLILNGDPGVDGQVLRRTSVGLAWSNVPLTDNDTTYSLNAVDGATNPSTEKVIRLSAGGSGSGFSEVVLIAGNNVSLTRSGQRITIDSSYVNTDTVTRIGVNGSGYTDGNVNIIGSGAAQIVQSGRTISVHVEDLNTTYTGESGVTVTADNKIRIGQSVGINDAVTFQQVTVSGNLVVQGTTTTSNAVTITTLDKFINLNDVLLPTDTVANGGGIRLKGDTEHTILWSNPHDSWTSSENWNLQVGREFRIGDVKVLDHNSLGFSITQSNLEHVGVLTIGRWNAETIGIAYGGTGQTTANDALNAFLPQQGGNSGKYLLTNGQDVSWSAIPPTYNGWTVGDSTLSTTVISNDIVRFIGTGSAGVSLDNIQKRIVIDATDTTYQLTVENNQNPAKKNVRITDINSNYDEVVFAAGVGVTLTRNNNELTFSVSQDLSSSASPEFSSLTVNGGIDAVSYSGDASALDGLTGAANGTYGSSGLIPIITVSPSGRITSIATAPNTGAAGAGGILAGGVSGSIQYNSNGGLAGNTHLRFEPVTNELTLDGHFISENLGSESATIGNLTCTNLFRLPSKNVNERNTLSPFAYDGTLIYNNSNNKIEMYLNQSWDSLLSVSQIKQIVSSATSFENFQNIIASL